MAKKKVSEREDIVREPRSLDIRSRGERWVSQLNPWGGTEPWGFGKVKGASPEDGDEFQKKRRQLKRVGTGAVCG